MTTNTHSTNNKVPIWKRAFMAIKNFEDTMDYDPFEQAVIDHRKRISDLETKIAILEAANLTLTLPPYDIKNLTNLDN